MSEDKALVFTKRSRGPSTHVLLIGVGDYPHLERGSARRAKETLGLGQLSSPPASARHLADWFISSFDCADKPLASVGLLLSEPGARPSRYKVPSGEAITVPRATLAEAQDAAEEWIKRAGDPADRLIFYFCGHGYAAGMQNFYLLRDFGASDARPMEAAINYERLVTGMGSRKPDEQLLILDACRDDVELAARNPTGGASLLDVLPNERAGQSARARQCAIFSTELDGQARGRPNTPSLCASAVVKGFMGAAVKEARGGWYVTTPRLLEAINDFQTRALGESGAEQRGDSALFADINVRRFRAEPKVPVFVSRDDGQELKKATITCSGIDGKITLAKDVSGLEYEGELTAGRYDFRLQLKGADFGEARATVFPTHADVRVKQT